MKPRIVTTTLAGLLKALGMTVDDLRRDRRYAKARGDEVIILETGWKSAPHHGGAALAGCTGFWSDRRQLGETRGMVLRPLKHELGRVPSGLLHRVHHGDVREQWERAGLVR